MTIDDKSADQPEKGWSVMDYCLGTLATLLLVGLILLTCVDVVARSWFNAPVNGAFELTQLMLAAVIFAALPMTTAAGEHIEVELLTQSAGPTSQRFFMALGQLISALVLFVLSWRLWAHAAKLGRDGAVTNSLELSMAPIGYFAAFSCALSGFIALLMLKQRWTAKSGEV